MTDELYPYSFIIISFMSVETLINLKLNRIAVLIVSGLVPWESPGSSTVSASRHGANVTLVHRGLSQTQYLICHSHHLSNHAFPNISVRWLLLANGSESPQ